MKYNIATKRSILGNLFRTYARILDRLEKAKENQNHKQHTNLVAAGQRVVDKLQIAEGLTDRRCVFCGAVFVTIESECPNCQAGLD